MFDFVKLVGTQGKQMKQVSEKQQKVLDSKLAEIFKDAHQFKALYEKVHAVAKELQRSGEGRSGVFMAKEH